jgi:glycosyltransferase involved in cell wall biosynthesis
MRFGINAQRLAGQRLGVGRYIEYLLKNWSKMLRPTDRMSIYVRDPVHVEDLMLPPRSSFEVIHPRLTGLLWEQTMLPLRAKELDVLFGPSYTLPLAYSGRCVVATHSVNEKQTGVHPWWHIPYTELYRLSAKKADTVIVPAELTKADAQQVYDIPAERIVVIPQGADDCFRPNRDENSLRETRIQLTGEDQPYVLFVGKLSQRRNIPALMAAFAQARKRARLPHRLVLFGPNITGLPLQTLAQRLGISDMVIQTDGKIANHRELVPIYNAADVFVHPSLYEGWSMTTVEALACGTAVIAANRGGLGELASGAAFMVDEPTADNLAEAIEHVLTDRCLRKKLQERAHRRGSQFSWNVISHRTLEVLRSVVHGQLGKA